MLFGYILLLGVDSLYILYAIGRNNRGYIEVASTTQDYLVDYGIGGNGFIYSMLETDLFFLSLA